jgi:hypothetical protein
MKKILVTTSVILFILLAIVVAVEVRKAMQADRLKVSFAGIKITGSIAQIIAGNLPVTIGIKINNYTNETYTLQQLSVQLYKAAENASEQDLLIADQSEPLAETFIVHPAKDNDKNVLLLPFTVSTGAFIKAMGKGTTLKDITNWYTGGQLGKKIKVAGYMVAEGIKLSLDNILEI